MKDFILTELFNLLIPPLVIIKQKRIEQKILNNNCVQWLFIKKIDRLSSKYWKFGKKT